MKLLSKNETSTLFFKKNLQLTLLLFIFLFRSLINDLGFVGFVEHGSSVKKNSSREYNLISSDLGSSGKEGLPERGGEGSPEGKKRNLT